MQFNVYQGETDSRRGPNMGPMVSVEKEGRFCLNNVVTRWVKGSKYCSLAYDSEHQYIAIIPQNEPIYGCRKLAEHSEYRGTSFNAKQALKHWGIELPEKRTKYHAFKVDGMVIMDLNQKVA